MKNTSFFVKSLYVSALLLLFSISNGCNAQSSNQSAKKAAAPKPGLHEAVISGNLEAVHQHIAAGTDLNEKDPFGGSTSLITASVFGETEIARALIEAGADVNAKNNEGSTALHSAAFFCRTQIVQALLDAGADKDVKNSFGSTPLESVVVPFEDVESIYKLMEQQLAGLGLKLDMDRIEKARSEIGQMLQ